MYRPIMMLYVKKSRGKWLTNALMMNPNPIKKLPTIQILWCPTLSINKPANMAANKKVHTYSMM